MRQLYSEIPNVKQIVIIGVNHQKINMKSKQLNTEQFFSPEKIWNKSDQNFSTMLFASWEIEYITWMFATLYTPYHKPKIYGQWDSGYC